MSDKTKENLAFWLKVIITLASAFLAALGAKAMGLSEVDSVGCGWISSSFIRSVIK